MAGTNTYKFAKPIIAIICLMTCFNIISKAQVLTGLQNSFNAYQKISLQEKIYVHTNKSSFLTGEILWFKIYNIEGSTNKMLDLSKVAYVELLDNNHVPVMQAKIALERGAGSGSLYLPFSLNNGIYMLRAYTNWMKNFDADYFFQKQIVIINPVKSSAAQATKSATGYDVQFFPEGGHLVNGLTSKVAFKVTAPDGKGQSCTGAIIDQKNDTVARFSSLKFGIGSFAFTPLIHSAYKAVIKTGDQSIIKELPDVSESGYVMQTSDHNDSWQVSVQSTDAKQAAVIYIIVHSRNTVKIAESASLVNGNTHFNIDKSKVDDGLSYITLFDEQQRPVCERLIFKRPDKKLIINANADEQVYSTRKKVSLAIATRDQDNKSLLANLSVSVFRVDSLQKEEGNHIAGYLWLNAALKGRIESPDYYLENSTEEANLALDNLMLSQGWTQFDWNKVLTGSSPHITFLPEHTGPIITGSMVNTRDNKPAKNITAYLTVSGLHHQLYTAKSDSTGKLFFNTKNFYGLNELILQTNWKQDSTYRIDITSPFSEQYGTGFFPALGLTTDIKNVLIDNSVNMQVQNIFSAKQQKQFNDPVADNVLFYGNKPTYSYLLDDYTRFPTMEEVIHEYVRLILITRSHSKMGLQVVNDKKTLPGEPLVLLDNKPIFDLDKVFSLDPLKIKKLDVITTKYIYGPAVFNGLLSFTTYNGLSTNVQLDPRAVVLDYGALQLERKFYSPVYDSQEQIESPIPDFRNVLYWNSKADTGPQGQNKLTFYTGDKYGRYMVIIEGIAPNGEAGSRSFLFEVKK